MGMRRVFQRPDGTLRIQSCSEGADPDQEEAKLRAVAPDLLPGAVDVDEDTLPTEYNRRHAWRLVDGAVVDDASVP